MQTLSYYLAYFSSLEFPINQMLDLEAQSALGFVFCQEHLIGDVVPSHLGIWGPDVYRDVNHFW